LSTLALSEKGGYYRRGWHEKWSRKDLDRPITIQTHISIVPEFIMQQILRHLKMSKKDFFKLFK